MWLLHISFKTPHFTRSVSRSLTHICDPTKQPRTIKNIYFLPQWAREALEWITFKVWVCACVFESKIYKWSADSIFIQLILCNSLCESQKVTLASTFRKQKRERKRRDYRLFVKHSFLMLGCCHLSLIVVTFIPCSNDHRCSYMLWSMSTL